MDFASLPPRADPTPVGPVATRAPTPDALSTRAETLRPVLAIPKADPARAAPPDDFQPLDTFEVGDNDHVPVPPEPPRQATVLAMIAGATEVDTDPSQVAAQDALTASLRDLDTGPGNPTVDIRR